MKKKKDLVRSWLRKAESDLEALNLALSAERALDAACFHSQQAVEKYLKAYMIWAGIEFTYVHDISKLIHLCSLKDDNFRQLEESAGKLTPYAVELRYDDEFWPDLHTVQDALDTVPNVKSFVLARLPKNINDR